MLNSEVFWVAVGSIGTLITVILGLVAYKKELSGKRPYFIVEQPGIRPLQKEPPYKPPFRIQISMKNMGIHAASNLFVSITMLNSVDNTITYKTDFSVANDIPYNSPSPYYNDSMILPTNMPLQFIVLKLSYGDTILHKNFKQEIYMRWVGVKDSITHPDFVHVNIEEKEKIIEMLSKIKK